MQQVERNALFFSIIEIQVSFSSNNVKFKILIKLMRYIKDVIFMT